MKSCALLATALAALVLGVAASEDPTGALEGVQDLSKLPCVAFISCLVDERVC